jgi:uncharacterized protein DUF3883
MNRELLQQYILAYKSDFSRINRLELYKWQAVKQFQDSWNPDAEEFAEMLAMSLSKTRNLMAALNYWPERMIVANAEKDPKKVKDLFNDLFDEESDVLERVASFQQGIRKINSRNFPDRKDYQDERAVLVYLNLKYPDNYFFYKYKMFKEFCEKVEHDFMPKRGGSSNITEYFYLCNLIRDEILLNNGLLKLHKDRIGESEYYDAEYNILTQDFVYAVTRHLKLEGTNLPTVKAHLNVTNVSLTVLEKQYKFTGKHIDFLAQHKRNKHIGDIGEQIVLMHETSHCNPMFANKIYQLSRTKGDGLGFDILSFDDAGHEKYIEVKTTRGPASKPFHVSGTELERSKVEGNKYFLYRLYNLDEENMTADCFIIQGDLSRYCINPTEYEVILKV